MERRRLELDDRRLTTIKALADTLGIEVDGTPEGAFFLLADVSGTYGRTLAGCTITSAASFAEFLLAEANVAVVSGADFAASHHARISYRVPPDRLAEALPRIADFAEGLGRAPTGSDSSPGRLLGLTGPATNPCQVLVRPPVAQ
ncbi:aminotransferase class I/II-fold pyridoxal phosphate-dependent enzyme [[Kitasatospora] papulosa]|uniref:aminotransferase class I/II-fold pyridoxal phosphate-dependent enzyme n=1 Tax=[Kitasatospora] papulosa TaxID=1464011 RepID=UPI003BAB6D96